MNGKVNSTGGSRFEPLMNTEDFRTSRTERESGGMSLELGKLFDVPQRSSSITDKLSNLLSSFGTKIKQSFLAKAVDTISRSISNLGARIKENRLANRTQTLAASADGKTIAGNTTKATTIETILGHVQPHGGAGARVFANAFVGKALEGRADDARLNPQNPQDQAVINNCLVQLLGAALTNTKGQGNSTDHAISELTRLGGLMCQAMHNGGPKEVAVTLDIINSAMKILGDEDGLKNFAFEALNNKYDELGGTKVFMRSNSALSQLVLRAGLEGIISNKDEVGTAVRDVFREDVEQVRTVTGEQIYTANLSEQEVCDAQISLSVKVFDAVFGETGDVMAEHLGEDGMQHLRDCGLSLLQNAKERGATDEEANKVVEQFYQNALFLKGINPQLTDIFSQNSGDRNYDPESHQATIKVSKIFQTIANGSIDSAVRNTKISATMGEAMKNSGIGERIATMYQTLGIPKLPDDAVLIESDEAFALRLNDALTPNFFEPTDFETFTTRSSLNIFDEIGMDIDENNTPQN